MTDRAPRTPRRTAGGSHLPLADDARADRRSRKTDRRQGRRASRASLRDWSEAEEPDGFDEALQALRNKA